MPSQQAINIAERELVYERPTDGEWFRQNWRAMPGLVLFVEEQQKRLDAAQPPLAWADFKPLA